MTIAALQRVLRAQTFTGRGPSHFLPLGLLSAGRETGNEEFEAHRLAAHVRVLAAITLRGGASNVVFRRTDLSANAGRLLDMMDERISNVVGAERWGGRAAGRDDYPSVCFEVDEWEQLVASGLGVERLAALMPEPKRPTAGGGEATR